MPSHLLLICTFTIQYSLSYAHILFSGREALISTTLNVMAFLYFSTKNDEFSFYCSYLFIRNTFGWGGHVPHSKFEDRGHLPPCGFLGLI